MRFSLRFLIPLVLILGLTVLLTLPLVDQLTFGWFERDLAIRSRLISNTLSGALDGQLQRPDRVLKTFNRAIQDDRLYAIALCDLTQFPSEPKLAPLIATQSFPASVQCPLERLVEPVRSLMELPQGPLHVSFEPVRIDGVDRTLILIHDTSFISRRAKDTQKYVVLLFILLAIATSGSVMVVAQFSVRGWVRSIRALVRGELPLRGSLSRFSNPELRPIAKDLRVLIRDLEADRRTRDESQLSWSPKTLKEILQRELRGDEILIVSNREPYIHNHREGKIEVQTPASGLVTALEPIMRACSGTWIAHGSGTADREVVDKHDHVQVPPDDPSYQIRRVWLTPEQEKGYYYGFSNEGLWPLCHIAHTRPVFRSEDWDEYVRVNQLFAHAVKDEAKTEDPVVLIQDYHFALLPRMIRELLPKATVISFWHIPWPNAEAFGICPWREEILEGLLGSTILGFHTQFHCTNFIESVDRFLETRIERETSTISYGGKLTAVHPYPISIEWPSRWMKGVAPVAECRNEIRQRLGLSPEHRLGFGVDRLDYTKGILERFRAVERLLELEPDWIGKFSFLQIAAPSRGSIPQYQQFESEVSTLATQINQRFGTANYKPIILKIEHHDAPDLFRHFRAADLCFVSSLHDGMNLVAKEFVAARDDFQGVLILSQFTGASRELPEALIINPYNIDQCALALKVALEMPPSEQRDRMRSMRGLIQEFNVYRWAGRMLIDAAKIRSRDRLFRKVRPLGFGNGGREVPS